MWCSLVFHKWSKAKDPNFAIAGGYAICWWPWFIMTSNSRGVVLELKIRSSVFKHDLNQGWQIGGDWWNSQQLYPAGRHLCFKMLTAHVPLIKAKPIQIQAAMANAEVCNWFSTPAVTRAQRTDFVRWKPRQMRRASLYHAWKYDRRASTLLHGMHLLKGLTKGLRYIDWLKFIYEIFWGFIYWQRKAATLGPRESEYDFAANHGVGRLPDITHHQDAQKDALKIEYIGGHKVYAGVQLWTGVDRHLCIATLMPRGCTCTHLLVPRFAATCLSLAQPMFICTWRRADRIGNMSDWTEQLSQVNPA